MTKNNLLIKAVALNLRASLEEKAKSLLKANDYVVIWLAKSEYSIKCRHIGFRDKDKAFECSTKVGGVILSKE